MAEEVGNPEKCPEKKAGKFWQMLEEMEENNEHMRLFSGSLGYPGCIRAIYGAECRWDLSIRKN